jgi:PAS domain S-box-containing protein
MGLCPSFFKLASPDPSMAWGLFRLAEFAYLDSNIPPLFKELLFTYLSRFCEVRYCVARHCAFLVGRGYVAGSPECPPISVEQAIALLREPLPSEQELPLHLAALEATRAPIADWPEFFSELGHHFRVACALVFIEPSGREAWNAALKRLLGPVRHDRLLLFLAFIRTAHFWTHTHPELKLEPDAESLLAEHQELGQLLSHESDPSRWQLREALRESDERHRQLVQSLAAAVYTCDASGKILLFNKAAVELWGREPVLRKDEWCGSWRIYRPDGTPLPLDECPMAVTLREGRPVRDVEIVIERPDGTRRHILPFPNPLFAPDGSVCGAVNVLVDITEQKRAEEDLREADRRKSEFLAMLAHELRNPLAPLLNGVLLLQRTGSDPDAVKSTTAMLERQVGHLIRLTDDLLDMSRITRGRIDLRREPVDLSMLVGQAAEAARSLFDRKGQELTVTLPDAPVVLDADPTRLAQVLGNLLNNACKFTDPDGHVALVASRDGEQAVVRVRDDGIGLSADQIPRVFDMFAQVDSTLERSRSGLGLGLTLVKRLVELHGGTIEARSDGIGRGSEFIMRLPLAAASAPRRASAATKPRAIPTPACRILVVDDNLDAARSLSQLLTLSGHEVHTALDGLEAVESTTRLRPDVVLMDIGLPKLNGFDAARRIRERLGAGCPILVALTGWGQDADRRRSRESGFDGHLVKPVARAVLSAMLSDLIRARAASRSR